MGRRFSVNYVRIRRTVSDGRSRCCGIYGDEAAIRADRRRVSRWLHSIDWPTDVMTDYLSLPASEKSGLLADVCAEALAATVLSEYASG